MHKRLACVKLTRNIGGYSLIGAKEVCVAPKCTFFKPFWPDRVSMLPILVSNKVLLLYTPSVFLFRKYLSLRARKTRGKTFIMIYL